VRSALRDAYPNGGGPRRNRLFAFGFDAYRLAAALRGNGTNVQVDGLTGRLTLDPDHRVHRELAWAQIHNGQIRIITTPAPAAPATATAAQ
jgi:outer membrane PBP1 activator LpoA protein